MPHIQTDCSSEELQRLPGIRVIRGHHPRLTEADFAKLPKWKKDRLGQT